MEEKADEREEKILRLQDELETKRRDTEREHELHMTQIFMSFIERIAQPQQAQQASYNQYSSSYPYPQ